MKNDLPNTQTIVRILSGGRVTLPEDVRKKCKVEVGDFMIIKEFYGEVTLTPAKIEPKKNRGK
jgi:bifunctional DNA-binding transcriptional regulator/antitoxin component of YhaV-PrlF toxin-antitoxin module